MVKPDDNALVVQTCDSWAECGLMPTSLLFQVYRYIIAF